ncbi:MAG: hypothetical protein WCJ10_02400 [Opitutaceae bacterium]
MILPIFGLATMIAVAATDLAQGQAKITKGPASKIYLAEIKGDTQIQNGGKIYTARQALAFQAADSIITTKEGAHAVLVYSNRTGLFIDQNTRVEIHQFAQEPFLPERDQETGIVREPSISQSQIQMQYGAIGICTSQLVAGSAMSYATPDARIVIRGGRLTIKSNAVGTTIDLLEGDVTVYSRYQATESQQLHAGERAFISAKASGLSEKIAISTIPQEELKVGDDYTTLACTAKKSVTFEMIQKKAQRGLEDPSANAASTNDGAAPAATNDGAATDPSTEQEIVAKPTVPNQLQMNVVISPDRLPGG